MSENAAMHSFGYESRRPLILVLDTSGSMGRPAGSPRIGQLRGSVANLVAFLRSNPGLRAQVDIAVLTFGSTVREHTGLAAGRTLHEAFAPVSAIELPEFAAEGRSAMLPALRRALELGREYRSVLDGHGITCLTPIIWLLTDGAPTDADGALQDARSCQPTADLLSEAERRGDCLVFAVGVAGADEELLGLLTSQAVLMVDRLDYPGVLYAITASTRERAADITAAQVKRKVLDEDEKARRLNLLDGEAL
jgi:uncharacterized protein YegL